MSGFFSIDIHSDGLTVATGQFASRKDASIQVISHDCS